MTLRSAAVAAIMVLVWTAGSLFAAAHWSIYSQQLLMLLGFGAILTVFLLQFPRLFLGSILGVAIVSFATAFRLATPEDYPRLQQGVAVSAAVAGPLCLLALWFARRPLRRGELVIVYAAVAIAIPWSMCLRAVLESSVSNLLEVQQRGEPRMFSWAQEMPWWAPTVPTGGGAPLPATLEAARGFARGNGGEVPWGLWWRPLAYWSAMCGSWAAMLFGILLLFRRRWIEHERLPFVWSTPVLQLIRGSDQGPPDPDAPAVQTLGRRGWIMFLIGFAFCLPGILFIGPGGEPLTVWTCPPWAGQTATIGGIDLNGLNLLPGVDLKLAWGPVVLVGMLLFPVDVLLTTAVTFIVLRLLLPGFLNSMGMATGKTHVGHFVRYGLQLGGAIGLVVWGAWYNRRTILDYLMSLFGRAPVDADSGDELGRRKVILMALIGFAVFVTLGTYAVRPYWYTIHIGSAWTLSIPVPVQMLVLTLMIILYTVSQVRMRAEGPLTTYDNNYASHQLVSLQRDLWNDHYTLASRGVPVTSTSWSAHWFQWGFCGQLKSFGPHNSLLEVFKVGHDIGVPARTLALVILWTLILVGVLAPVLYLKLIYLYGYENSYQGMLSSSFDFAQWSERAARYGLDSTSRIFWFPEAQFYERYVAVFNVFYGIALVGALFHLRREYPRFPISPVGVVLAGQGYSGRAVFSTDVVWFSFLIAGVAKALVFRWMGVRSFREKVQPALVLILCGLIYGMMLFLFRHVAMGQGSLK